MKSLFRYFLIISASLMMFACEQPDNGGEGEKEKEESEFYEFPLNVQEDSFEAGDGGVTINVSSVKEKNIIFNVVPGSAIKSYRMNIYPKAMLYNLLLNEGCVDGTAAECEDKIIQLLSGSTGTSSIVFNGSLDDYSAKEFDWMNTEYSTSEIVPDCDYYILVLGCYDEAGANPASLSICQVRTPAMPIIGDPQIAIEAETGYRAFIVKYHPNEDCKYFYHWIWSTEEMGQFIDLFGETLMRDFCRSATYTAYDASLEENLAVKRTFDISTEIIRENTAVAVAVDANGTPSAEIMRLDFALMDIPEGDFSPKAEIKAGDRIGATLAYLDVSMEKSAMSCFYRLYSKEDAEKLKNASEAEKKNECISLANEGWGVANKNFSFNSDLEMLTGDSFSSSDEVQAELAPDTEYVVAYVAKNNFAELSELCFSEPFRTKPLVMDAPETCIADVTLELTDVSRWGFNYNFSFDYETTACYRFQIVWPYDENSEIIPPHYENDKDDHEKWMKFFYDTYQTSPATGLVPIANMWVAEKSGYDGYNMYGYESGVTYVVAYCAEDINGVAGPVKFATATTTAPDPGPNPVVTLDEYDYDEETGEITARFNANTDTKMIKYFAVTSSDGELFSSCALNDLVNNQRRDYDTYMTLWESQLIELGLSTSAETVPISVAIAPSSTAPVLLAAIAIGEDDGVDVYSPVACKIFHKGEFKDLSDYRTPPSEE